MLIYLLYLIRISCENKQNTELNCFLRLKNSKAGPNKSVFFQGNYLQLYDSFYVYRIICHTPCELSTFQKFLHKYPKIFNRFKHQVNKIIRNKTKNKLNYFKTLRKKNRQKYAVENKLFNTQSVKLRSHFHKRI